MEKIKEIIRTIFNVDIGIRFPRHSVRFAKKHFNNKPITAIEIGTLWGKNALSILKELNIEKIYLIDPYESYEKYNQPHTKKVLPKAELNARKRLSKYGEKIVWVKKYSDEAINYIQNKIDFVYIDGNHEYVY